MPPIRIRLIIQLVLAISRLSQRIPDWAAVQAPPSQTFAHKDMHHPLASNRVARAALVLGVAMPVLYFGAQLLAASFYPGYSFLNRDASTLGSDSAAHPWVFNSASILMGFLMFIVAWGFLQALRRLEVDRLLAWVACLAIVSFGIASTNGGLFPLPDPRHTSGMLALLGLGTFVLPVLLPAAMWKTPDSRGLRLYFIANALALIALLPIFTGLIQIIIVKADLQWPAYQSFLNNYHGLLQRIAAFIVVVPIGVTAYILLRRRSLWAR
jgi:hypothetical membrane protein